MIRLGEAVLALAGFVVATVSARGKTVIRRRARPSE